MRHLSSRPCRRASMFALAMWLVTLSACGSDPSPQPVPRLWVVYAKWVDELDQADRALADRILRTDSSVLLGYGPGVNGGGPLPATSWVWASYKRFRQQIEDPGFAPFLDHLRLVMYDPEAWSATPTNEQQHPVVYMQRFAHLAKRHGWQVLLTPNPNLMTVPGGDCVADTGESPTAAYARCNIAGSAAKPADIVETQAQGLESDPAAYSSFVQQTASQARLADPQVRVIAGLTTSQGAFAMYAAWNSVRDVVDGYYLSIGSDPPQAGIALEFLRMLPAPTPSGS